MSSPNASSYASAIRPFLSSDAFAPARSRLLWLPLHVSVITLAMLAISRGWVPWPVKLVLSLVIGLSFAGLTFLGHETLHGAVVRGRALRHFVGWIGFLPFIVSPTLWIAWHNRIHHGRTNRPELDPDAYPTLDQYRQSRLVRWVTDHLAPGRRRWFGIALSLLVGFTVQSSHMLFAARARKYLSSREHRRALLETGLGLVFWVALASQLGFVSFLLCYGAPLLVANVVVMSFIFTNHSLSPLTDENDPLANSLSVTTPRLVEWLTLGFGYHVEHHLFPAMSTRHAGQVRDIVRSRWPDRYQSQPLMRALLDLHRSPRVYKTHTTLVDPRSGQEWPCLQLQQLGQGRAL